MIEKNTLKIGSNVHYQPDHYQPDEYENGVVKEIPSHTDEAVRVVYNCNGEWHRYTEYTSALTNLRDLKPGWRHDEEAPFIRRGFCKTMQRTRRQG